MHHRFGGACGQKKAQARDRVCYSMAASVLQPQETERQHGVNRSAALAGRSRQQSPAGARGAHHAARVAPRKGMLEVGRARERFDLFVWELFLEKSREPFAKLLSRNARRGLRAGGDDLEAIRFRAAEVFDFEEYLALPEFHDAQDAPRQRTLLAPQVQHDAAGLLANLVVKRIERGHTLTILTDLDWSGRSDRGDRLRKIRLGRHCIIQWDMYLIVYIAVGCGQAERRATRGAILPARA